MTFVTNRTKLISDFIIRQKLTGLLLINYKNDIILNRPQLFTISSEISQKMWQKRPTKPTIFLQKNRLIEWQYSLNSNFEEKYVKIVYW